MTTSDPTEYLLARYAEDEDVARTAAYGGRWHYSPGDSVGAWTLYDDKWTIASLETYRHDKPQPHPAYYVDADANGAHIARHDPARVLAAIAAKRAVVTAHPVDHHPFNGSTCETCYDYHNDFGGHFDPVTYPCDTLRALLLEFADREDFPDEWRTT